MDTGYAKFLDCMRATTCRQRGMLPETLGFGDLALTPAAYKLPMRRCDLTRKRWNSCGCPC